jgi:GMP synthase-like glutamine amidotransferase
MVIDPRSPKVPLEIYNIENKEYMLICYSMESVAYQLDIPISFRRENKKELFALNSEELNHYLFYNCNKLMYLWRNHYGYVSSLIDKSPLLELISYQNESMILFYKNSVLIQFHPERTTDGLIIIENWINNIRIIK